MIPMTSTMFVNKIFPCPLGSGGAKVAVWQLETNASNLLEGASAEVEKRPKMRGMRCASKSISTEVAPSPNGQKVGSCTFLDSLGKARCAPKKVSGAFGIHTKDQPLQWLLDFLRAAGSENRPGGAVRYHGRPGVHRLIGSPPVACRKSCPLALCVLPLRGGIREGREKNPGLYPEARTKIPATTCIWPTARFP